MNLLNTSFFFFFLFWERVWTNLESSFTTQVSGGKCLRQNAHTHTNLYTHTSLIPSELKCVEDFFIIYYIIIYPKFNIYISIVIFDRLLIIEIVKRGLRSRPTIVTRGKCKQHLRVHLKRASQVTLRLLVITYKSKILLVISKYLMCDSAHPYSTH